MNKAELTAAIVKKTGFTKKDAEKAIAAVTDVITETLAAGEKVQIVGFGGFEVRSRPARVARNPRTGEQISIEASKAPVFKAGKALKDASTSNFFLAEPPSPMAVCASPGSLQRLFGGAFFDPCPRRTNAV